MLNLVRSSSFSRRSKSTRAPTDPINSNDSENAVIKKEGAMKKIVRSASFGRKNKQQQQQQLAATPAAAAPGSQESTDIDDSMSRSATPDTDRSPNSPDEPERSLEPQINLAELEAETGAMEPQLYGWLKKRNQKGSWAKRYFFVDEQRGTMGYSKGVKGRSAKPSAILPLGDITRLEPLDETNQPCAFKISCPPIHLTVMAVSVKERKRWMRQIELRSEVWKQKQREKTPVADVQAMLREASASAANVQKQRMATIAAESKSRDDASELADGKTELVMGVDVSDEPPVTSGVSRVSKWGERSQVAHQRSRKGAASGADADDEDDGAGVGVTSMPSPPAFKGAHGGGARGAAADMQPRAATVEYIDIGQKGKKEAALTGNGDDEDELAQASGCLDISDGVSSLSPAAAAPANDARKPSAKLASRVEPPAPLEVPADRDGDTPSSDRASRRKGRSPAGRQQRQSGGEAICETVELYSDGEDDEGSDSEGKVNSANKASGGRHGKAGGSPTFRGTGPVPLAAMISSDEEDEVDEEGDAIPSLGSSLNASVGRSAAAALAAAKEEAVVLAAAPAAGEAAEELETARHEEPKRMRKKLTGSFDDDSEANDAGTGAEQVEEREALPFARPAPVRAGGVAEYVEAPKITTDTATAAEANWDSEEEEEQEEADASHTRPAVALSTSYDTQVSRPVVVETVAGEAAPAGIVADDNFAEEDWDDEDEDM